MFDGLVVLEKDIVNVRVDRPEIALELANESRDRCLGNREQAADNIPDPILLARAEVTSDDPACIREQLNRQASYMHTHNRVMASIRA
jgi:hypothetical protein